MTARDGPTRRRLSTGHEVTLPLEVAFAMGGVVVLARRQRLESVLPDALSSVAIAPGVGCVVLLGVQYRRVRGLEPYDEFAAIVPATAGSRTSLPVAQLVDGEVGGYVHWLPVTTDASVALGRELWGYPKERADVAVTGGPRGVRAVVRTDDASGEAVRLEVPRPRIGGRVRDVTLSSFTARDGTVRRNPIRVRGRLAVGPPTGTRLEIHPDLAAELGLWTRPLVRLYGTRLRARLLEGEPIEPST